MAWPQQRSTRGRPDTFRRTAFVKTKSILARAGHTFFDATSLRMALSSMASAKSFLSRVFSSSGVFRRRASDTSKPPYLAFHL